MSFFFHISFINIFHTFVTSLYSKGIPFSAFSQMLHPCSCQVPCSQPSTVLYWPHFCGPFSVAFLLLLNAKFMNNFQKKSRVKCTTRTHATFPGAEDGEGYDPHLRGISKRPEDAVDDFVNAFGSESSAKLAGLAHSLVGLLYCAL